MSTDTKERVSLVYRDSYGNQRTGLQEWVDFNLSVRQPLLGGAVCPAVEYTFAVSDDGGETFRNPTDDERSDLADAVKETGRCCRPDLPACGFRTIIIEGDYETYMRDDLRSDLELAAFEIRGALDKAPSSDDGDTEHRSWATEAAQKALAACDLARAHDGLSVELSEAIAGMGKAMAKSLGTLNDDAE